MAFKLKLPQFKRPIKPVSSAGKKSLFDFKLPFIGHLPIAKQLALLSGVTTVSLLITIVVAYLNYEEAQDRAEYVQLASSIELNIERLDHDAALASDGERDSFNQLREARTDLTNAMMQLDKGSATLPPTKGAARKILDPLLNTANTMLVEEAKLEAGRSSLLMLNSTIDAMGESEVGLD